MGGPEGMPGVWEMEVEENSNGCRGILLMLWSILWKWKRDRRPREDGCLWYNALRDDSQAGGLYGAGVEGMVLRWE